MKTVDEKILEGRQYRDFSINKIEKREETNEMIFDGYATVFDKPYLLWGDPEYEVYEVIDKRAFDECDMSDVIMQYNHSGHVYARSTNNTLQVRPEDFGLRTTGRLDGTQIGRMLFEEISGGYTTKMSIGFSVAKDERSYEEDYETGKITVTRRITKIKKLYDVSAVSLPANDATSISARSYSEGVIAEVREEIAKREARQRQKRKINLLMEATNV